MLGLEKGKVTLLPHDVEWEREAARTVATLGGIIPDAVEMRHIGSTAIRGISAKPIIDIAVALASLCDVGKYISSLADAGFIRDAAYDGERRYYFYRASGDRRTHHIHVMEAGSREYTDDINFVDYLNANADAAAEYERRKTELAMRYASDRPAYSAGKKEIIERLMRDAAKWRERGGLK